MAADARRGSTRPCSSASAPRSTSTPGSSRRRPSLDAGAPGWSGSTAWRRSRAGSGGATCATTRASCVGFARQYARHRRQLAAPRPLGSSAMSDVAVIGLGRVGLPLALAFADARPRPSSASTTTPSASPRCARAGCRSRSPAPRSVLDRVGADASSSPSAPPTPRRRDHIVLTLGTPAMSHIEIDLREIRAVLDDLLPHLREGHAIILRSTIAPGTTDFVAGYLDKHRGFAVGEDVFVAHVPERIAAGALLRGDRDAAVHRRRRRRALGRGRRRAVRRARRADRARRRRCRPSWRRSGPTSCATRRSRCPTC